MFGVHAVDDTVAAERVQVAGRWSEVDSLQRDACGEAGDRLRAHELGGALLEAEQVPRIVGGEQQPGLGPVVLVVTAVLVAAQRDERNEQRDDGRGDDTACEEVHGVSLLRVVDPRAFRPR